MDEGTRDRSLLRHRDFMRLWSAESVSQLGSQVSLLALPLVAISVLHATTFEVGALTAVEFSPFVLFGLPAGAIVDRLRRRPILIWCDIGRAAALASVPIASAFGSLTYAQLVAVVFVTGTLTVFFDVAYQSILPAIVDRDQLTDGNAKLEVSRSSAQTAGPGIGGLLVQWIGAASAVTADAVSFVASALLIRSMRAHEPPPAPADETKTRLRALIGEIREGLRYVLRHPVLRMIAGSTATSNFFSSMSMAVFLLYAVRERHYSAGLIGIIFTLGNVGALVGAVTTARVTRAVRLGPAIMLGMLVSSLAMLLIGLAPTQHAAVYFVVAWLVFGFGGTLYNIDQVSPRQAITPHGLQGRMNASMRFMVWGTMPFGSLAGAALGSALGLRPTLLVGGIGGLLAVLWVLSRPVLALREIPSPELEPESEPAD
ncbi:MAG TPA: MFS transporter [Acidimicrobiia bacterium]|nr:MFS transporter [Acidimicrobiia bacterium]